MAYPYNMNYGYNPQQTFMPQSQPMPQMQGQPGYTAQPVTGREEAMAVRADYFNGGVVMPDLAHDTIYLKRFNPNTGASDFFEFRLFHGEQEQSARYVTVEEFERFQKELSRRLGGKVKGEVVEEYE